ncbi:MAG: HAD family hydrolase [Eubacteriales bacterium]
MTNLIFDYDGTLHNSINIYAPAFRIAYAYLVSLGITKIRSFTDKEISKWLGFNSIDMWNAFMPDLHQDLKDECSNIICNKMLEFIRDGKSTLYPNALEVLLILKRMKYNLIFLSNCKRAYMEAHIEYFKLNNYFTRFYCTEDFGFSPKYEIFNTIKQNHDGGFIIIGDRIQDIQIAEKHNLKSIGCLYGYGNTEELKHATKKICSIYDLVFLLNDCQFNIVQR